MKNLIGVLVLLIAFQANAQDFNKVKTSVLINQYDAAKADYDKIIAKKPTAATTAEGHYWKAKIYSGLAKDPKNTTALSEVKKAIDEYITADASNNYAIAKENGSEPFFDLYLSNFKNGVAAFNEKNWKVAATEFDQAVKYSDIIFTQGWATSKQKFDTTSLLYAGFANQNANNKVSAAEYYKRIIEANIKTLDVIDCYKFVLIYYADLKTKDSNFDKYYNISVAAYPDENWNDYKLDYFEKNLSLSDKVKLYDDLVNSGKITESDCLMFGDAFIAGKYDTSFSNSDLLAYKASEAYRKAFGLNPQNVAAAFNAGIAYYNQFSTIDEKMGDNRSALQNLNANKPAAPKDPKKKLAFEASFKAQQDSIKKLNIPLEVSAKAYADTSITWIENAFNLVKNKEKLDKIEKNIAGRSVDFLATLYQYKRDKVRGKDQKAYDALDAKFNEFDKLHDAYLYEVRVGFTKEQVKRIMGEPKNISTTTTEKNISELYFYNKLEIGFNKDGKVDYIHEIK